MKNYNKTKKTILIKMIKSSLIYFFIIIIILNINYSYFCIDLKKINIIVL